MIYKCPFCNKGKRKLDEIKIHIKDQHIYRDHWARWIHGGLDE